jgi:hypothetical protein
MAEAVTIPIEAIAVRMRRLNHDQRARRANATSTPSSMSTCVNGIVGSVAPVIADSVLIQTASSVPYSNDPTIRQKALAPAIRIYNREPNT